MSRLTMGSLFDGIGGFPLAAIRSGITPVWASEIEAFPIEVTKQRFPSVSSPLFTLWMVGRLGRCGMCPWRHTMQRGRTLLRQMSSGANC